MVNAAAPAAVPRNLRRLESLDIMPPQQRRGGGRRGTVVSYLEYPWRSRGMGRMGGAGTDKPDMNFWLTLPEIRCRSCLLGWAFRPRNFMKNRCLRVGHALACQPAGGRPCRWFFDPVMPPTSCEQRCGWGSPSCH